MRTLSYSIGTIALIRELWYTTCQMKDEAPAAPFLQTFIDLHTEARTVVLPAELDILEAISAADALVDKADGGLDTLAGRAWRAVDEITEAKTKKQLKANLFKGLPLSRFRRPVLGGQLLAQSAWGSALKATGIDPLVTLAADADPLVKKGEDAAQARTEARQKNRQFRDVGARKQFIDKVNGARLLAYGALAKAPLDNPTLPRDYADSFFLGEPPPEEEETIDDVKASIAGLTAQIAERQKQLVKMEADAAAEKQAEAERQAKQSSLDDLKAQESALKKKIEALQVELSAS